MLYRNDSDTVTRGTEEQAPRHQMWREVNATWGDVVILVPLFTALVTAALLSLTLTYFTLPRGPELDAFVNRLVTIFMIALPFFWLLYSGAFGHILHLIERILNWDIDGGGVGRGKSMPAKILLNANVGRSVAEAQARKRYRDAMVAFVNFASESPQNRTSRILNGRFGSRWVTLKKDLDDAGYVQYDSPGRPNSTWHLAYPDPDLLLKTLFQSEDDEVTKLGNPLAKP